MIIETHPIGRAEEFVEVGANLGGADIDCGGKVGEGDEEFAFYAGAGTERTQR